MTSAAASRPLDALIQAIDECLPQTQCTRCGYPACRPYAEAVAQRESPSNRCEPGGMEVLLALSTLMAETSPPAPYHPAPQPLLAQIRDQDCIGCARCLPACPVDAIVGSRKLLHRILSDQCTGCQLCIEPCPVDCIDLIERPSALPLPAPEENRRRYLRQLDRKEARKTLHQKALDRSTRRQALIEAARRAREARKGHSP